MPGAAFELFLEWVLLIGSALVAIKLYRDGLHRKYRVFFAYFLFRLPRLSYALFLDVKSPVYAYLWAFTEPVIWVFYVWVVLELCRLVLERHKGLYTLGKWAMYLGMAVSVTLSVLSLLARFRASASQRTGPHAALSKLYYFYAADRGVTFCLAIFLLLMLFLLSRYPVALPRNVILHAALYTMFFLSSTLSTILSTVFGLRMFTAIDTALTGVSALCVMAWLFFLNPKGEEVRVNIPHFGPEHEARILFQLDSLNATLLKVSREKIHQK